MSADKESFSNHIDLFTKLVGLAVPLSFAVSCLYDWGYYSALSLSFQEIPTEITDHLRSALEWFPKVITTAFVCYMLEMLTVRIEGGMTEDEIIKSSKNPKLTKKIRSSPSAFFLVISILGIVLYILLGDIYLFPMAFCISIIWGLFVGWVNSHPRIFERKSKIVRLATHFLPPAALWIFLMGYNNAVVTYSKSNFNTNIIHTNNLKHESIILLRQFNKRILAKNSTDKIVVYPWRDILRLETKGEYQPSLGIICSWFNFGCDAMKKTHTIYQNQQNNKAKANVSQQP